MFDEQEQSAETLNSEAAGSTAAEDSNTLASQVAEDESLYGEDADSQEQTAEEEEEVEIGEKKYALPKSAAEKLKSERLMHADYTQKTQTVATERQQVAAEREQVQRQAQEQHEYLKEAATLVSIDEQIAQYNALDWNKLIAEDPVQAMQYQQQQKALEGKRHEAYQSLTQKQQQIALNEQQATAKQVQDADAYMKREIPGFTPERSNELAAYAAKEGLSAQAMAKSVMQTPAVAKWMHKAELYDKLVSKQAPKTPPVAAAKPALKVGSQATVKKDPTRMTDAEFAAYRRRTSNRK